ncbi:hypothetical protein BD769DRAFT_1384277 [Suillus cothurnatus]|nr:hypothetical protein BD769DRAFT_1384277 [Suillus cothurnatus]
MTIFLDDPQTYNWHSWANNQEIPGLWGRLPEHSAEYQTAMLEAIQAEITLEPNTESSGPCSEMWCKGIINMIIQPIQNIQTDKSELDVLESSANVVEDSAYKKAIRKGRGHPKGVLNSTVMEIHLLPGSPMKLHSKKLAGLSFLSQHSDAILEREISEVVEAKQFQDQRLFNQTHLQFHKTFKLWIRENDVPALDLSKLFSKKSSSKTKKSLLPSTFWDYSLDTCMVANEESESSLYDEDIVDQAMDTDITFQDNSTSNYRHLSSEASEDIMLSSPTVSLNCLEEFDETTSAPPVSSPLSEDDLQMIEDRESSSIPSPSLSLSIQEESVQPSSITSKTSKGTLIFTKSLDNRFVYDSVIFVPNAIKSKSKGKGKGKGKFKDQPDSAKSDSTAKVYISDSHPGPSIKSMTTLTLSANMSKVAKACQKAQTPSGSNSLMWNKKFLKFFSCLGHEWIQSAELQSNIKQQIGKLMASKNVQKQLKTDMDVIVCYVYWMKNQQGIAKLSDEPKIGFKALFTLLEMKS